MIRLATCLILVTSLGLVAACSDDGNEPKPGANSPSGGTQDGGPSGAFVPPAAPSEGFLITASGEDLAVSGYTFTQEGLAGGDPPAFVDGWSVAFDHVIVTIDNITVSADPDKDPGNPKHTGPVVASVNGPFAVDLTVGGDIVGKSGSPDEKTVAIAALPTQHDGSAFDPATRYAFGYDFVSASPVAKNVNLDASGLALYEEAKAKGWTVVYAGTATYSGPTPAADSTFAALPKVVRFTLGFRNPSSYANCQNTDLQEVSNEFPRGVQASEHGPTTVQITLHTDHAFWDKLNVEGAPLHFDPIAAQARVEGDGGAPAVVTTDDLAGADITGFRTRAGQKLPARSLVSDYVAPEGTLTYDANGTRFQAANSFASYLAYAAASGGHMNADGACEVTHNFTP